MPSADQVGDHGGTKDMGLNFRLSYGLIRCASLNSAHASRYKPLHKLWLRKSSCNVLQSGEGISKYLKGRVLVGGGGERIENVRGPGMGLDSLHK